MNTFDKIVVYTALGAILYGIYGTELPNEREYKQKQLQGVNIDTAVNKHLSNAIYTTNNELSTSLLPQIDGVEYKTRDYKLQSLNSKIDSFNIVDSLNRIKLQEDKTEHQPITVSSIEYQFNQRIQNKLDSMNVPENSNFRYILRMNSKRNLKLEDNNYSIHRKDKGNYNRKGQLVGSNRSVAAKTYETYLRRKYKNNSISVSKQDMINLTIEECIEIYYNMYMNSVLGDNMITNKPILIDMIFNAYCNAPSSCITAYNRCIRTLISKTDYSVKYGESVLKSKLKGNGITKDNIELFNYICNDIKLEREFYKMFLNLKMNSFKRNPQVKTFKGWLKWGKDYPISYYN